ncbi:unnamed protein product [Ranitomeya imitator]|uniref:Uncharacterized protein n=1 Tax=Ranitomeya imitator TaxID=111125 RepID=A0ABN9LVR5_9NEOB|nr:unnamed protein product [Ranitomeya imitator]
MSNFIEEINHIQKDMVNDDFDQFDKPGAERSRRRRTKDDDWDSELEDDLLEEDFLPGRKTSLDLSDEELNDDLLQSDEEELEITEYSTPAVTVSLNATTGDLSSFDLSKSINEESAAEYEEEATEEVYEEAQELEAAPEDQVETYEENYAELADDQVEYEEEEAADEVLDLEINEPLDEFQVFVLFQHTQEDEEYSQSYKRQKVSEEEQQQYVDDTVEAVQEQETQELLNESEEMLTESQELPSHTKVLDEDDEDEDEEESGRIRFKSERKEGTIIRLSDTSRQRRNIPETLENLCTMRAVRNKEKKSHTQVLPGHLGGRNVCCASVWELEVSHGSIGGFDVS